MLMLPQAASVPRCERLWLKISATLIFLSFHAGSHLTIGVASWTWSTSAFALDLKRKLATKSCIAPFLDTKLCPKTGRYKLSLALKLTVPASTFRPCSTCVSCLFVFLFFPRRLLSTTTTTTTPPPNNSTSIISLGRALGMPYYRTLLVTVHRGIWSLRMDM